MMVDDKLHLLAKGRPYHDFKYLICARSIILEYSLTYATITKFNNMITYSNISLKVDL